MLQTLFVDKPLQMIITSFRHFNLKEITDLSDLGTAVQEACSTGEYHKNCT